MLVDGSAGEILLIGLTLTATTPWLTFRKA
jgi:hypothetical protein